METAYRIYPLPNVTIYTEEDVKTLDDVAGIFDYCQHIFRQHKEVKI